MISSTKKYRQRAFTLVETILAITIMAMIITATTSLTQGSLASGRNTMQQLIATQQAQEGVEIVRNIRDSNWLQNRDWLTGLNEGFFVIQENKNGQENGERWSLSPTTATVLATINNPVRTITLGYLRDESGAITTLNVLSTVTYFVRDKKHTISLTTELTNWKKGPL